MNRRLSAALLMAAVLALPLHAEFASIARAIDAQPGVKRIWIPFLGIARVAVRMIDPNGVHDFQLATFEGTENLDPKRLHEMIRTQAGAGFVPLVQVRSRKARESSFIYARPSGNSDRLELLVLSHDGSETVLVRVEIDGEVIAREMRSQPRDVTHVARR